MNKRFIKKLQQNNGNINTKTVPHPPTDRDKQRQTEIDRQRNTDRDRQTDRQTEISKKRDLSVVF